MLIFGVIFATTASKRALLIQLNWVDEFLIYWMVELHMLWHIEWKDDFWIWKDMEQVYIDLFKVMLHICLKWLGYLMNISSEYPVSTPRFEPVISCTQNGSVNQLITVWDINFWAALCINMASFSLHTNSKNVWDSFHGTLYLILQMLNWCIGFLWSELLDCWTMICIYCIRLSGCNVGHESDLS
jgi:hypothetical protein